VERADILLAFERCGIQPTPQRVEVAGVLLEKAQHLSAEQIIDRLRKTGSRVSKATVYNTLNLFGERGLVTEIVVDPERRYYDSNTDKHHHFYNVDTGQLTDIPRDAVQVSGIPKCPDGGALESIDVLVRIRNRGADKSG
jgi:Fur family transcriptional regulator, iron response regulator